MMSCFRLSLLVSALALVVALVVGGMASGQK